MKETMKIFGFACLGFLLTFLVLEAVFHLLPVETGRGRAPMVRFGPTTGASPGREFSFARDWKFTQLNRGKINSDGFIGEQDYPKTGAGEVIAVIGDSFVEAVMIPSVDTLHATIGDHLSQVASDKVVGLGLSDAELATFHHFFERATEIWDLDFAVFVIGEGDLADAFEKYPGRDSYVINGDSVELDPAETRKVPGGLVGRIAKRLRLGRYFGAQLLLTPSRIMSIIRQTELNRGWLSSLFVMQEEEIGDQIAVDKHKKVIEHFVAEIAKLKEQEGCGVLFVVHRALEDPFALKPKYDLGPLTQELVVAARNRRLPVLDIYPVLHRLSVEKGMRPRWLDDGHWTGEAYRAVGRRIAKEVNVLR